VRHNNDSSLNLVSQLGQLLIPLFNFLIESLVFNLELFKVDQVKAISQLLFLFEDLFTVSKLVAKLNVLKSILVHFSVLSIVGCLPIVNATSRKSFTSPTKHGVLSYGAF
jgi:hypothetical protein